MILGKLDYPQNILPRLNYVLKMDLDSLIESQQVYLLRRSELSEEDTFNGLGQLKVDAILSESIPFLSLNILGGLFKIKDYHFSPSKKGRQRWEKRIPIFLSEYLKEYEVINDKGAIFIDANNIQNCDFPYKQSTKDVKLKEIEPYFNGGKPNAIEGKYNLTGSIKFVHDPTHLNYWHVELNVYNISGKLLKYRDSVYINEICEYIVSEVITINSSQSITHPHPIDIHSSIYIN